MCDSNLPTDGSTTMTSTAESLLELGARAIQDFTPLHSHCAHLNAFHIYAAHPELGPVEASHYCNHFKPNLRQCIIYDPDGRLLGIEYMVPEATFAAFPPEERKLWHSHLFEVKSGQLVMPQSKIPEGLWEPAETKAVRELVGWYGKTFHLWKPERHPDIPFGEPELMMSFTKETPAYDDALRKRDERFALDSKRKQELRKDFDEPKIHPDVDQWDQSKLPRK